MSKGLSIALCTISMMAFLFSLAPTGRGDQCIIRVPPLDFRLGITRFGREAISGRILDGSLCNIGTNRRASLNAMVGGQTIDPVIRQVLENKVAFPYIRMCYKSGYGD